MIGLPRDQVGLHPFETEGGFGFMFKLPDEWSESPGDRKCRYGYIATHEMSNSSLYSALVELVDKQEITELRATEGEITFQRYTSLAGEAIHELQAEL